jgi:ABC-type Fe3+/spermidine/putrescine transport system ATPase subunit
VHAFLGPSGAGKTTTIRILLGLHRRDLGDLGPSYRGGRLHDWLVDYLQIRAP